MNTPEILERLVGFATVSRDSNLTLIDFVRDFLEARGIAARLYTDPTGAKANLYASVGPTDRPGVLLSGHTDVVPVDGQSWSADPFVLRERGTRLLARGAADMKGFLACALSAMDRAVSRPLSTPLSIGFSYDEEVGCLGVRSMIEDMATWTHRPRFCIVGEPTLLKIAIGHKGKTALKATARGRAAHSANPAQGVNAIYLASDLVQSLRGRAAALAAHGARETGYEVEHTTLHVGVVRGGTALNIVPDCCEVDFEIRNVAGDDPSALVAAIEGDAATIAPPDAPPGEAALGIRVTNAYPGLSTDPNAEIVGLVAGLTGHRDLVKVGFGSEAGLYSERLGIPSVVCGPGSIDQAHKPDEYIERAELERCDAMLDALLERLA